METDGCKGRSGFVCTRPVSVVVSCVVPLDTCLKAGRGQLGAAAGTRRRGRDRHGGRIGLSVHTAVCSDGPGEQMRCGGAEGVEARLGGDRRVGRHLEPGLQLLRAHPVRRAVSCISGR